MKLAYAFIAVASLLLAGGAFLACLLGIAPTTSAATSAVAFLLTIWSSAKVSQLEGEF